MKKHLHNLLSSKSAAFVSNVATLLFMVGSQVLSAQSTYPVQYYVPLPEGDLRNSLRTLAPDGTNFENITTVISVVTLENGAILVYDHWEDGYDPGLNAPPYTPTQSSTLILGDNNPANGNLAALPAGVMCDPMCPNDMAMPAGIVLTFDNDMDAYPSRPNSPIRFDGKDRIASNRGLAVSRAGWSPDGPKTLLAGAVEVLDTFSYGLNFVAPVGQNTPNQGVSPNLFFEVTNMYIQAAQNGTVITVDADGPGGAAAINVSLSQGQSYRAINVNQGATVSSNKKVQVHLLTGDIGANYESRWFTLYPNDFAGKSYYNPIASASNDDPSAVFLYNLNNFSITVTPTTTAGVGSAINIPANSSVRYNMPIGSGAKFTSTAMFVALGLVDTDSGSSNSNNQTHDWGMTLLPENYITQSFVVGWGVGGDDLVAPFNAPDGNYSPVWVVAAAATTIYVDYDGDGAAPNTAPNGQKYDSAFPLNALQVIKLYDTKNGDNDQTAMRIFSADGTKITGAWGQDPITAPAGTPSLDLGTSIPPALVLEVYKDAVLNDLDADNLLDPNEQITYRIIVANRSVRDATLVTVQDIIPTHLQYVAATTLRKSSIPANNGAIADDGVGTAFPFDGSGRNFGTFKGGQIDTFEFKMLAQGTVVTVPKVTNGATVTVDGGTRVFNVSDDVPVDQSFIPCGLNFSAANYSENALLSITVTVPYIATGVVQTIQVTVTNGTNGDEETITLTETGANTNTYTGTLQSSISSGAVDNDGTILALAGHTLTATYTNNFYNNTCSDTAPILPPTETKKLYLSTDGSGSPDQDLDRVNPTNPVDNTLALSPVMGIGSSTPTYAAMTSQTASGAISSITFNHTTGVGSNRLMLVGISIEQDDAGDANITSVTYGAQSLTFVGAEGPNGEAEVQLWRLVNPASGTNTVTVNISGAGSTDAPL